MSVQSLETEKRWWPPEISEREQKVTGGNSRTRRGQTAVWKHKENLKIQEVIPKDKEGDTKPIRIYLSFPENLRKPSQL
jgi:hypothetical protein